MHELPPAARFMLGMVAFAALLMLGWRQGVTHEWLAPLTEWNAHLTAALLDLQGIEVMRRGATLRHASGFSWHIDLACTGLPILALGVAAIALYPTTGRLRVRALALGLPLLFGVNLVRMVHLVRIGIEAPQSFDFAHEVAWRVVLFLLFAVSWTFWRHQARRPTFSTLERV